MDFTIGEIIVIVIFGAVMYWAGMKDREEE